MTDPRPIIGSNAAGVIVHGEEHKAMYLTMLKIRRFEEKVGELVANKEIICPCHLSVGEEAVATGVCAALRTDDWVFSTHRSHAHYIAKGGSLNGLMAELYGKENGCSHGRGGSMHISSPELGLPGSSAIVAGTIPLAVGAALAFLSQGNDSVSVAFFGDGATNEGVFYESLNFASLKKLPVLFICENNLYSTHMPISECLADTAIYKKANAFNVPGLRIDGNNVSEIFAASSEAVALARSGKGPSLIECLTYRWYGHVGPNDDLDKGLRNKAELELWKSRCPLLAAEAELKMKGVLSDSEQKEMEHTVLREIEESINFAKDSPYPAKHSLLNNVFKERNVNNA